MPSSVRFPFLQQPLNDPQALLVQLRYPAAAALHILGNVRGLPERNNGLPLGLERIGAALGLEQQKLREGHDLIRYFCCPRAPTAAKVGRVWNLPEHSPEQLRPGS